MGRQSYEVPGTPTQTVYPISDKDAAMERRPWFLPFEPLVAVLGGATQVEDRIVAWNDFVCTRIGFTSGTLGFPAAPGRWRVQIQDIQASVSFQPEAFDITALIGGNHGISDNPPVDLPVPWVFLEKTTIRVTFENRDPAIPNMPSLLLIGYLTNWQRDAAAAQGRQALDLAIKQNLATMRPAFQ